MRKSIATILLIMSSLVYGQQSNLNVFKKLVGKDWHAQGKWGDGSKFKQDITFEFSLDSSIVIAKSKGYTDQEQTKYGLRNHGIRHYDKVSKKIKFWEFDVFGGLTTGEINVEGDNLYYTYKYGDATVTDAWIRVDNDTFEFIVGARKDGKWLQKYLETKFKASN